MSMNMHFSPEVSIPLTSVRELIVHPSRVMVVGIFGIPQFIVLISQLIKQGSKSRMCNSLSASYSLSTLTVDFNITIA